MHLAVKVAGRTEAVDREDRGDAQEGEAEEEQPRLRQRLRQGHHDGEGHRRRHRCRGDNPEVEGPRRYFRVERRNGEQHQEQGQRSAEQYGGT